MFQGWSSMEPNLRWYKTKATILLIYFRVLSLFFTVNTLLKWFASRGVYQVSDQVPLDPDMISRIVHRASFALPWFSGSTIKALVVKILLNQAGYEAVLNIGVVKQNEQFYTHAWVACGNQVVIGHMAATHSEIVASFSSQPSISPASEEVSESSV